MKKKIIIIAIIVISLLVLVLGLGYKMMDSNNAIEFGLKDVGKLVTQEAYVTIVKDSKEHRTFFKLFKLPFTESRRVFSYTFVVQASINFENIDLAFDDDNQKVIVKLTKAEISNVSDLKQSLNIYLDDESLFSNIDLNEHNDAMISMTEEAKKTAINNGILTAADDNAKVLIEKMIKSDRKYKDYEFVFKYVGD